MTAEIAILNAEAVALAADSAVTMTTELGPKVYQSANKIFGISHVAPVALMVYDSAKFLGVPWETVAKTYREQRGHESWPTLAEHAQDFLDFITASKLLFPDRARERCAEDTILVLFVAIRNELDDRIASRLEQEGTVTETEIRQMVAELTKELVDYFSAGQRIQRAPREKEMTEALSTAVQHAREQAFEALPLSSADIGRLTRIATAAFIREVPIPVRTPNQSGVVIAGFGSDEIYPGVRGVVLEALVGDVLKALPTEETTIEPPDNEAVIMPFAQREIVDAFIGGIDPDFKDGIEAYWRGALADLAGELPARAGISDATAHALVVAVEEAAQELVDEFAGLVEGQRHLEFAGPILDAVAMLPKDELGAMAEAFVNLTSFKRKVSTEAETVGGPIDVAVISKGDGLIWIKRKHYFDPRLNPQYFASRFGGNAPNA